MMTEDEVPVVAQRTPPPATSQQGGSAIEAEQPGETVREVRGAVDLGMKGRILTEG